MQVYHINNKRYYLTDDLRLSKPHLFKGCQVAKSFAIKQKLTSDKYLYGRLSDNDSWIKSDGSSRKFDKLFLRKKWIDETYLSNKDEFNIIMAPKIIELDDNEKFFDSEGNIIDIQVRGEREFDKCYFKVEDIANGFCLKNLHKHILDKKGAYELNKHYVYFYLQKNGVGKDRVKKIYLYYVGFLRLILNNNKIISASIITIININRWLSQFICNDKQFIIDIPSENINKLYGYTYCITSPLINGIKIGFWTGSIKALESRYKTYYGEDIQLYTIYTKYPYKLEQKCMEHFSDHKLAGELFKKKYLESYVEYLEINKYNDC